MKKKLIWKHSVKENRFALRGNSALMFPSDCQKHNKLCLSESGLTREAVQVVITWFNGVRVHRHISAAEVLTPPLVCGSEEDIHTAVDQHSSPTNQINWFGTAPQIWVIVFFRFPIFTAAVTLFYSYVISYTALYDIRLWSLLEGLDILQLHSCISLLFLIK